MAFKSFECTKWYKIYHKKVNMIISESFFFFILRWPVVVFIVSFVHNHAVRASEFFQNWWAEVTHGAKMCVSFSEMMGSSISI